MRHRRLERKPQAEESRNRLSGISTWPVLFWGGLARSASGAGQGCRAG